MVEAANKLIRPEPPSGQNASRVNRHESAGAKVTVASKLPFPYRMRVFKMVPFTEPILGGGVRESKIATLAGEVWINGVAKKVEASYRCRVENGYALTEGVDKDLFDQWCEANRDEPIVRNGIIMAHEDTSNLLAMTRENRDRFSNLEPMNQDPMADPRTPKGSNLFIEQGRPGAET